MRAPSGPESAEPPSSGSEPRCRARSGRAMQERDQGPGQVARPAHLDSTTPHRPSPVSAPVTPPRASTYRTVGTSQQQTLTPVDRQVHWSDGEGPQLDAHAAKSRHQLGPRHSRLGEPQIELSLFARAFFHGYRGRGPLQPGGGRRTCAGPITHRVSGEFVEALGQPRISGPRWQRPGRCWRERRGPEPAGQPPTPGSAAGRRRPGRAPGPVPDARPRSPPRTCSPSTAPDRTQGSRW